MKAEALTESTIELPKSRIMVELDGVLVAATGFIIRKDEQGEILIIKVGKSGK